MDELIKHQSYYLKPSRLALGFQIVGLLVIFYVIYLLSPIWVAFGSVLIAGFTLILFRKQDQMIRLEQLDYDAWSVQYQNLATVKQIKIEQFIDHIFYISVSFQGKNTSSLIIWQDQVSQKQWKSLKTRCKF